MSDTLVLISLVIATGLLTYKLYKDRQRHKLNLPPGPRSYPVIGHLLSIPTEYEHLKFMELGRELGSKVFTLSAFGTTIIVLNDKDDAMNLLDKRSTIYSDRTCPPIVQDPSLFNWSEFGSLIGYGDRWRKYRRLMNPLLSKQAITAHRGSQEHATRKLLRKLLENHKDMKSSHELETEFYLAVSATLFRSLYGYEAESSEDSILLRTHKLIMYFAAIVLTSNCMVNSIPALRYVPEWFPGAGWKRQVLKWKKEKEALLKEIYNIGLENMKKDDGTPIMVASLRTNALKLGLTEEEADDYVQQIAITLVAGGADTTISTLLMFILAMVLHPEVQKKAQAELDSVIGNARLPTFEDRAQLSYIERMVQETLRWGPVTPIGEYTSLFVRTTSLTKRLRGYRIPKGTIIFGNVWAMTRDETVYKYPEVFDPDRYLDPSTPPSPVFGWGRMHLGEASLFITIASILMTFNIGVAQDENGKDVMPSGKMINGIVIVPQEFLLKLTPRSASHEELIWNNC
ncbi:O-methylsterigmatocystin oxidoreductase [Rhizoctonia solani]|nr:O-methylsterigmatocystin oxidoreductase [Rhizoctonia solani]